MNRIFIYKREEPSLREGLIPHLATLRHMEIVKAVKKGHTVLFTLFDSSLV